MDFIGTATSFRGMAARLVLVASCMTASAAAQATIAEFTLPTDPPSLLYTQLADMGDINGDGHADFILGMPYAHDGSYGVVQLRSGGDGSVLREWTGTLGGAGFGFSVDAVEDIDGDGLADVVVGEPGPYTAPGRVSVYSSATGLLLHVISGEPNDGFGICVAGVGDIDGDGRGDFAAGAPNEEYPESGYQPGYAKVFSGASGALLALIVGDFDGQGLGRNVRSAGDVNADGVPDLAMLVGGLFGGPEPFMMDLRVYSGAWIASRTGPALLVNLPDVSWFGSVDRAGDVDGDGFDDLLLGVPLDPSDETYPGGFFVLSGKDRSTLLQFLGSTPGQGVGKNVAGAGDLDHDGTPDLIASWTGGALAVSGKDGAVIGSHIDAGATSSGFLDPGSGIAGVGDVNADGTPDWAVALADASTVTLLSQVGLWTDLGQGLAGANGVPLLSGSGLLVGGTPATLRLDGVLPSSPIVLVVGLAAVNLPFKGGVFVPEASFLCLGLVSDELGGLTAAGTLPLDVPQSTLWFQAWQVDPSGPQGFAASNALRAQVP